MKKIILPFLVFLFLLGCSNQKLTEKKNPINTPSFDDNYIEKIPENAKLYIENLENKVILSQEEIKEYNKEIEKKTNAIYEIEKIKSINKKNLLDYINSYKMPSLPKYDGNLTITSSHVKEILENRNMDTIKENIPILKGIIVHRTNLKSFPTNLHFFNSKDSKNFDKLQETELTINTKALILHESKDKKWYFVLTNTYYGWIKQEDIALLKEEDFWFSNNSFVVITDKYLEIDTTILDMGVKLPYLKTNEIGYEIAIPIKGENNYVEKKIITIKKDKAHIGFLPYTKRNVIVQAFKYEGEPYSWAGMDKNTDCSGFISNIYKTFGFIFPRNTTDQKTSVGNITSLENKTLNEKLISLENNKVSLLYQPGHVMLYLGKIKEKHFIIHASGNDMKVIVSELNNQTSYLKKIDRIVTIEKIQN